jgi:putative nucleotidyltransferase with HDIG domain
MKKCILFVDDERNVLDGLRRLLRPMRNDWEMVFAPGAAEALAVLAEKRFHVVVTDMRMPGMDGEALLGEVMRQYPDVVRIVLSGQSSKKSTLKSVGVAHQFLAKPCDADMLKRTIDHAFALRDLLSNEDLKETISQLGSIPSMPSLYEELLEELQHPDAQDPGMSAKVLQLVNSAFFGLAREVSSPEQATALLGVDTMKILVLSIDVFSQFSDATIEGLAPETVQKHCCETARVAKQIAVSERAAPEVADAALMAGLLHDVGKLILAGSLPKKYRALTARTRDEGISLCQAEREALGATHAEVGAYLLGLWGLPDAIVEATAFHHDPIRSLSSSFTALTAVYVANTLVNERAGAVASGTVEPLDLEYLEGVGSANRVAAWRAAFQDTIVLAGGAA